MYTQCPVCNTVFRLQIGQLKAAKGQVRCSRCLATFDALDNLYEVAEDETSSKTSATAPAQQSAQKETVRSPATSAAKRPVTGTTSNSAQREVQKPTRKPEAKPAARPQQKTAPAPAQRPASRPEAKPSQRQVTKTPSKPEAKPAPKPEARTAPRPKVQPTQRQVTGATSRPEAKPVPRQEMKPAAREVSKPAQAPRSEPTSKPETKRVRERVSKPVAQQGSKPVQTREKKPAPRLNKGPATPSGTNGKSERFAEKNLDLFAEPATPPTSSNSLKPEAPTKAEPSSERLLTGGQNKPKVTKEEFEFRLPGDSEEIVIEDITLTTTGDALSARGRSTSAEGVGTSEPGQSPGNQPRQTDANAIQSGKEENETIPELELDEAFIDKEETEATDYALPLELEQTTPRGGFFSSVVWFTGILVMLAGLALQYLYYYRAAFAVNPELRPVLTQMCDLTGCQLPPLRNIKAIVLGDHLIQSHPRYENSLLITATLINNADFAQPYPVLEVIMTDLQQNEIARRRFLPNEYLVGESGTQEFAPGSEVPVMLEVLDPGQQAVGFEFNFY